MDLRQAKIRLAAADDGASAAEIYGPYCLTPTSFELAPPSAVEMSERIERVLRGYPWLVLESPQGLLGYAYGSRHRERAAYLWTVECAVYVHSQHHRKGVGRALYTSLFELLSLQGYRTACAGITLPNHASIALHEALGFRHVGIFENVGYKMGEWRSVGWYQRGLAPLETTPGAPQPLPKPLAGPWLAAINAGLDTGADPDPSA